VRLFSTHSERTVAVDEKYEYGFQCRSEMLEHKALWAEGLLTMREFSDRVSKSIREDDGIPF
jgi:hypothetical protein